MIEHVIVDGNNLLHTAQSYAPSSSMGRLALAQAIGRWAQVNKVDVVIVFDGPTPSAGLEKQMGSARSAVRFSESRTADDLIVDLIHAAANPGTLLIVTSDTAIKREARYRRCQDIDARSFAIKLFARNEMREKEQPADTHDPQQPEKEDMSDENWLRLFGYDETESDPFDGFSDML